MGKQEIGSGCGVELFHGGKNFSRRGTDNRPQGVWTQTSVMGPWAKLVIGSGRGVELFNMVIATI